MQDFICPIVLKTNNSCCGKFWEHVYIVNLQEPVSCNEVNKHADWRKAMDEELSALQENDTWKLVELPKGVKPVSSKWIFKLKMNTNGSIIKRKARLVATGYLQIFLLNCTDSYASVAKIVITIGYLHMDLFSILLNILKNEKQTTIERSSVEVEYRALTATILELLRITYMLRDFKIKVSEPIALYCDNLSTIHKVENRVHHQRTKHVDIDYHFIRDQFSKGCFKHIHIKSKDQVADLFIKPLFVANFHHMICKMNIVSSQVQLEEGILNEEEINSPCQQHNNLAQSKMQDIHQIHVVVFEKNVQKYMKINQSAMQEYACTLSMTNKTLNVLHGCYGFIEEDHNAWKASLHFCWKTKFRFVLFCIVCYNFV